MPEPHLKPTTVLNYLIGLIIVLVPFFAILTVWAGSLFGHYTALRLWDELVFLLAAVVAGYLLIKRPKLSRALKQTQLLWLIAGYTLLELVIGLIALLKHHVTLKALGYGLIVDLRFPAFLLICLIAATQNNWLKRHWRQLLLIPAAIVVLFGLAQHFILPDDFLRHFGYNASTIYPYQTVNQNLHYVRVMSTLRGANPLGAYLVLVISALATLIVTEKQKLWRLIYGLFFIAALITLYYSYSRSAWLGAGLSILVVIGLSFKTLVARLRFVAICVVVVAVAGFGLFAVRHDTHLQDAVFHTDQQIKAPSSSDQGHLAGLKQGFHDVVKQPFGDGPGTAGPASVYNNNQSRIAEDFFVQIAQEVGWLGLVLFILINWLVAKGLFNNQADSLSIALLAALVGLTLVNLFSHAWADDTLSYVFWGLAGVALAPYLKTAPRVDYEKPKTT